MAVKTRRTVTPDLKPLSALISLRKLRRRLGHISRETRPHGRRKSLRINNIMHHIQVGLRLDAISHTVNRADATTESLCTSRPAHRLCNVFIVHLHSRCRRHEVFVWEIYPTCSQLISTLLGRRPAGRQIRVLRRLPVKLIHGLDCTKAMPTSAPAALQHTPVSSLRVAPADHGN